MKIFFIFSRKARSATNIPPLGIMSLAAVLRQHGSSDIRLFDLAYDTENEIVDACVHDKPDIIGLSTDSISFERGCNCLSSIRNSYTKGHVILGGVHPTISPGEALMKTGACLAVIGEGETAIIEVVDALSAGKDISPIRGIAYIEDGELVVTEKRPFIEDLDTVPFPARDLLPMKRYLQAFADIPMLCPTITVFASRGCNANCIYCQPVARTLFGKTMRHRSVGNVIEEIEQLKRSWFFRNIFFTDDELLFNGREWVEALANEMINRKLNLRWTCQARIDQVQDESLIALMREAGCYAIGFGVESGSQRILNAMRKGYKASMIDEAFRICRKHKIITTCNLMVGTPGESYETINESKAMIARVRPNLVRISITTPTPGSDLHALLKRENRILISHLSDFDRWVDNPIKLDNFSKEDIRAGIKILLTTFYADFYRSLYNPVKFLENRFFFRILLLRYLFMLRRPLRLLRDLLFYVNYFKHRKGHASEPVSAR